MVGGAGGVNMEFTHVFCVIASLPLPQWRVEPHGVLIALRRRKLVTTLPAKITCLSHSYHSPESKSAPAAAPAPASMTDRPS